MLAQQVAEVGNGLAGRGDGQVQSASQSLQKEVLAGPSLASRSFVTVAFRQPTAALVVVIHGGYALACALTTTYAMALRTGMAHYPGERCCKLSSLVQLSLVC
jgi:hypothetical protein